jgi:hypothetical protein
LWPPLASPSRIARRRVKVCAVQTTYPRRLELDAPSALRCWDDNGGTFKGKCRIEHFQRDRIQIQRKVPDRALPARSNSKE